jgi:hypothetical protein
MKVFYTPARDGCMPKVIDAVVLIDGEERGAYSLETLAQLAVRYPGVLVGDSEIVERERETAMRTEPEACTEEQFWDALECLPPLDWQCRGGGESFKMVERLSGRMTRIYARTGTTYWSFVDRDDMTHAAVMAKVTAAVRGEVVA